MAARPIWVSLMSMRILIIGGHGKVARLLTPRLANRSDDVTAVIRHSEQSSDVESDGARPLVDDVASMDVDALASMMQGQDAVVWLAGAGGSSAEATRAVDRDAAIRSMDAAVQAGVQRYVMVSYFGAGPDHGVDPDNSFYTYAEAKTEADQHLQGTSLNWTILRPGTLTNDDGTGRIETARNGAKPGKISRADVAHVAEEVLHRPETAGSIIEFNNGSNAIEDELKTVAH